MLLPLVPHGGGGRLAQEIGEYAALAPAQGWFWLYLGNFYFAQHGFAGHGIPDVLWSLAIEEQFYLVWPLLVLLLPRRALAWACGVVILGAVAWRLWLIAGGCDPVAIYVLTPGRLDGLAVGGLLAVLARGPRGIDALRRPAAWLCALGAVAVGVLVAVAGPLDEFGRKTQSFGFTALALFAGGLVAVAASDGASPVSRVARWAPLRVLGKYAYALYLFHLTLQPVLRTAAFRAESVPTLFGSHLPGLLAFNALCVAVSLAAAWASWNLLEKHCLRLKDRFAA